MFDTKEFEGPGESEIESADEFEFAPENEELIEPYADSEPVESVDSALEPKPKSKSKPSAKSPAKTKTEPREGGTGTRIKSAENLSGDERRVLTALVDGPATIAEIAARYRRMGSTPKGDTPKGEPISAYRRVINALRRPRARGLVKQVGRGTYEATAAGRKLLA